MAGENTTLEAFRPLISEAKRAFSTDISYTHDLSKQAWLIRGRRETKEAKKISRRVQSGDHSGV